MPPSTGPGGLPFQAYRAVLLGYLVLITALSRNFARVRLEVAGLPVFATEIVILLLSVLLAIVWVRQRRSLLRVELPGRLLLAYLAVGAVFAVVGLGHAYGLSALRDFALVYYVVFFFLTLAFLQNGGTLAEIAVALVLGGTIAAAIAVVDFAVAPELAWQHATTGHVALFAWAAAVWLTLRRPRRGRTVARLSAGAGVLVCTVAVYLSAYRTMLVVVAAGTVVLAAALWSRSNWPALRRLAGVTAWFAVAGLAVLAHGVAVGPRAATFPDHGPTTRAAGTAVLSARWVRGLGLPGKAGDALARAVAESRTAAARMNEMRASGSTGSIGLPADRDRPIPPAIAFASAEAMDSVGFRRLAWRNAMARIRTAPWTGIGFGPNAGLFPDSFCDLVSSPLSNCGNAHNTYLTVAMRMGIPALVFLLAVNVLVIVRFVAASRHEKPSGPPVWAAPFMLALLACFAAYALTSLFLESPYLAAPYWVVLGSLAQVGMTGTTSAAAAGAGAC